MQYCHEKINQINRKNVVLKVVKRKNARIYSDGFCSLKMEVDLLYYGSRTSGNSLCLNESMYW